MWNKKKDARRRNRQKKIYNKISNIKKRLLFPNYAKSLFLIRKLTLRLKLHYRSVDTNKKKLIKPINIH